MDSEKAGKREPVDSRVILAFPYNFMRVRSGSSGRTLQLLHFLRAQGCHVSVYSISFRSGSRAEGRLVWRMDDERAFAKLFPDFELKIEHWSSLQEALRLLKNVLLTCLPALAQRVLSLRVPGIAPRWSEVAANGPALLIIGYAHSAAYFNGLVGAYRIIDQHDLEFVMNRRAWKLPAFDVRVLLRARRELGILNAVDEVLCISYAEWLFCRSLLDNPRSVLFPYLTYFNKDERFVRDPRDCDIEYDLLFVGAKGHFNIVGLETFLTELIATGAKYRFAIAGSVGDSESVRKLAGAANVRLLGYVEDLHELYSKARASICPTGGGGTKTKIIESLQHCRPVFACAEALEGLLPGYEKCVFALDQETIQGFLAGKGDRAAECKEYLHMYRDRIEKADFVRPRRCNPPALSEV